MKQKRTWKFSDDLQYKEFHEKYCNQCSNHNDCVIENQIELSYYSSETEVPDELIEISKDYSTPYICENFTNIVPKKCSICDKEEDRIISVKEIPYCYPCAEKKFTLKANLEIVVTKNLIII